MNIDASIPLQVRAPQPVADPLDQYAKALTLRGLVSQGTLQDLQIRKAQQDDADDTALRELAPQAGGDMTKLRDLVYQRGLFNKGMAIDKQLLEKQAKEAEVRKNVAAASHSELQTNTEKFKLLNGAGLGALTAYQEALGKGLPEPMARALAQPAYEAGIDNLAQSGLFDPKFLAGIPRGFDPSKTKSALSTTLPYEKILEDERARRGQDMTAATAREGHQVTARGQDIVAQTTREGHNVTRRGQDITASTTIRGQNLTDDRARETTALARDPVVQGRLAEARQAGEERGKAAAQAQINLPQATATAERAVKLIDDLVRHPGLRGAVGSGFSMPGGGTVGSVPGQRFIPGTPQADFQARLDEIKGGAFMEAFNSLRGGGQITEKEGEKATAAITRMGLSQSEAEFVQSAREFQDVVRGGLRRAQQRSGAPAAGAGASGSFAAPSTPPTATRGAGTRFLGFENQ